MAPQPQAEAKTYVELTASTTEPSSAAHLQKASRRCWERDGRPVAVHSAEAAPPYSWGTQAPSYCGVHLVADTLCGHLPPVLRQTGHQTVPSAHNLTRPRNSPLVGRSRVDESMTQSDGASCPR